MRSKEQILKRAKERIENLTRFSNMVGLNDSQLEDLDILIELVELVEAQPQWIPCSERLPEEDGEYLVWYECGEDEDSEKGFMLVPFWTDIDMFGVYQDIFDSHTLGFVDSEFIECETVVAWQPLPESYKGEQE